MMKSSRIVVAGLFAATMLVKTSPGLAQTTLTPGQPVQGRLGPGETVCHALATTPGTQWRITQTAFNHSALEVGRGTCEALTTDLRAVRAYNLIDRVTRIEFVAGGGVYVLRTSGLGNMSGEFVLRAEQRPGVATTGHLPPGPAFGPWLEPGWTPGSVSSAPANAREGLTPGNVFKDCEDICPEMVVVPAGTFTMGSPAEEPGRQADEGPRHPVALVHDFAVGRYEVTFAEYDACVTDGGCTHRPSDQGWGRGRRPAVDVSWNDAQAYVAWLSARTGQRYALPSESEWEYAARAGSNGRWQTGNAILTDDANILNAFAKTVPVGSYPPNGFGLHDVHGNVLEWVLDCLDTGYVGAPNDGSAAAEGDCVLNRMGRGGWYGSEPDSARFAQRYSGPQTMRQPALGFRVSRAL